MAQRKTSGRYSAEGAGVWTKEEHAKFLKALETYPNGPWKIVSEIVGTRSARQTMTHAQKYRQKMARHQRGLRSKRKTTLENQTNPTAATSKRTGPPRRRSVTGPMVSTASSTSMPPKYDSWTSRPPQPHPSHAMPWPAASSPSDVSISALDHTSKMQMRDIHVVGHYNHNGYMSSAVPYAPDAHYVNYHAPMHSYQAAMAHANSSFPALLPFTPVDQDLQWIEECYNLLV